MRLGTRIARGGGSLTHLEKKIFFSGCGPSLASWLLYLEILQKRLGRRVGRFWGCRNPRGDLIAQSHARIAPKRCMGPRGSAVGPLGPPRPLLDRFLALRGPFLAILGPFWRPQTPRTGQTAQKAHFRQLGAFYRAAVGLHVRKWCPEVLGGVSAPLGL